ncbi:nucleotide sugar dehydrogenase [Haloprofundus marisrubri]|uniref:UDP-N-acetyl-D-mannosamine dehydrogenase n=1 Tax=Haloprofundus marisrubri TaxID=1514971 RepID=A0A0W1R4X8_9EURY|nr:nucleotide sugar dehydrogenase [Haloprofundus marisrubri]KTG08392.1 nucleotide sugar dehydrogenase [Haloprofundus marisrubri]
MSSGLTGARRHGESRHVEPVGRTETICVVGLGYVGLPLAVHFDRVDQQVIGYDIDDDKIGTLSEGVDTTGDLSDAVVADSDVEFTSDPATITDADYVIVTVPTPVDEMENPDLRFVESAGETVGEHMTPDTTVVLESTVFPGATRSVLAPALEEASGLTEGEEFFVAYSPERATPGDEKHGLRDVVKVVGADDPAVLEDVADLYECVVDAGVHRTSSLEAAEASKVVENVQRDLNIALMNELAVAFDRIGINTQEVLDAAGTKWNFHDYSPGLVGGHCIPVDPFYFAYRSKMEGYVPELTLKARDVNRRMPEHVSELALKTLNDCGNVLGESRVVVLGLTYKPNVADIRTSKVDGVIDTMQEYGVDVLGFDPYADPEQTSQAFGIDVMDQPSFENADGIVLATPHDVFESLDLDAAREEMNDDPFLLDVCGELDAEEVVGHGFTYRRV